MSVAKSKGKRQHNKVEEDGLPMPKADMELAKFLRFNVPSKEGRANNMPVEYFSGKRLLDFIAESKYGKEDPKKKTQPLFPTREAAIAKMQYFIEQGVFVRMTKILNAKQLKKLQERKKALESRKASEEHDAGDEGTPKPDSREKKPRAPAKFDIATSQDFVDELDAHYIWMYHPTKWTTYLSGGAIITCIATGCLYPVWPMQLRVGAGYLAQVVLALLGVLLGLMAFKPILYGLVWICSFGKVHFWLFPNLTEDVGFFESFQPFYSISFTSSKDDEKKKTSKKDEREHKKDDDTAVPEDEHQKEVEEDGKRASDDSKTVESATASREASPKKMKASLRRKSSQESASTSEFELLQRPAEAEGSSQSLSEEEEDLGQGK